MPKRMQGPVSSSLKRSPGEERVVVVKIEKQEWIQEKFKAQNKQDLLIDWQEISRKTPRIPACGTGWIQQVKENQTWLSYGEKIVSAVCSMLN